MKNICYTTTITTTTEDPMTKRLEKMYKEFEDPAPRNREERRAQMKKKRR